LSTSLGTVILTKQPSIAVTTEPTLPVTFLPTILPTSLPSALTKPPKNAPPTLLPTSLGTVIAAKDKHSEEDDTVGLMYFASVPPFKVSMAIDEKKSPISNVKNIVLAAARLHMIATLKEEYNVQDVTLSIMENTQQRRSLSEGDTLTLKEFTLEGKISFVSKIEVDPEMRDSLFEPFFTKFFSDKDDFVFVIENVLLGNDIEVVDVSVDNSSPTMSENDLEEDIDPFASINVNVTLEPESTFISGIMTLASSAGVLLVLLIGLYWLVQKEYPKQTKETDSISDVSSVIDNINGISSEFCEFKTSLHDKVSSETQNNDTASSSESEMFTANSHKVSVDTETSKTEVRIWDPEQCIIEAYDSS